MIAVLIHLRRNQIFDLSFYLNQKLRSLPMSPAAAVGSLTGAWSPQKAGTKKRPFVSGIELASALDSLGLSKHSEKCWFKKNLIRNQRN